MQGQLSDNGAANSTNMSTRTFTGAGLWKLPEFGTPDWRPQSVTLIPSTHFPILARLKQCLNITCYGQKKNNTLNIAFHSHNFHSIMISYKSFHGVFLSIFLLAASRVVAYALFWVVHFKLLWVPIMVRWMIHTFWIYFDVAGMSFVNSIAFGGVYLFSFVTTSPGRQVIKLISE